MLYKLSISNIKKSVKDYAIYFVTLILGVCIFYIFNSMDSQTAILEVTNSQGEMIELLMEILSYVSIFVSLVLGFFFKLSFSQAFWAGAIITIFAQVGEL